MKNLFIILFLFLSINCSGQVEVDKKVGVKVGLNDTEKIYQCPVTITAFTGDTLYFRAILNSPYIYVDGLPESPYIVTQPITFTINYNTTLAFELELLNGEYLDSAVFEFDIFIRSFTESFELTAYQVALVYNSAWRNNQSLIFDYVENSSELQNAPPIAVGWDTLSRRLKFASLPGSDIINNIPKKIGRFRVTNATAFVFGIPVGLIFYFNEAQPISTIIAGESFSNINAFGTFKGL